MKKYKKCSGQCVDCVLFYTVDGCGNKHNGENNFIPLYDDELDRLGKLFEEYDEQGHVMWIKEVQRKRKLKNIISLTKNKI